MINTLALNLIADVMKWDNEVATQEYAWLRLMSAMKYDGYADFRAGVRFLESLVSWLRQFEDADRPTAYHFIKTRLVYISGLEMHRVIETFIPEVVTPYVRRAVAGELGIKPYEVWQTAAAARTFAHRLRRCLFVGLSDGSRIDVLRRANAGRLSQEQVVPMMNVDDEKWKSLAEDLRSEEGPDAVFDDVYLIDDFTASGTTFIRFPEGKPKGKLAKFEKIVQDARGRLKNDFPLAAGYTLHIHHYVSTTQAREALLMRLDEAKVQLKNRSFGDVVITEGMRLPVDLALGRVNAGTGAMTPVRASDPPVVDICRRYYDHGLFIRLEKHCREAGQLDMKFGYANCALPVVLEHNTPNNSIPLLWAETAGQEGFPMRPLFHRRDRHG
ncbi:phosphoribosyltransferase-like protein [Rhizobium tumorigenes]|uniref:PRTase-CE domain-containing protein n=1 Tax=Rhizobium tumorigenes TaxID=2041385 RepID=A0AAF1KCN2_9HYPH|nr:hypothetical protein [Rhizobium tumorigenes]WFR97516.1 hypothetical protein PR017_20055 [Rhizobium tumorigenes]